jgi:chaperonin cofactor prefoldin
MTADALKVRIAYLEGAYEQVDKRLGEMRTEIQELGRKL